MNNIKKIQQLYDQHGSKSYGENISQLQHAVQVARLAEQNNASDALIAACLLHDIGHLLYNDEIMNWGINDQHEIIGAKLLKELFGYAVSEPVKLHVTAKRYMCTVSKGYCKGLSPASRESLLLQGGPLNNQQKINKFEHHSYFNDAIKLRYWDDEGKNEDDEDIDFSHYVPLLKSLHSKSYK